MTDSKKILVRRIGSGNWTAPESSSYEGEKQLQAVVADSTHWIPGVPEGAFKVRELPTSAGPVDVMIVAPDGAMTAVECKLDSNPEKRRTVIGQLIDYVSAIREDGFDRFVEQWAARGGGELKELMTPEAIDEMRSRLDSGTIALCWVADRLDNDLRRLIGYLNRVTQDQMAVTALQLAYARHGDVEILIPSTYGGEIAEAKAARGGRSSEHWTRHSFSDALADPTDKAFLARLLELLNQNLQTQRLDDHGDLWFGTRPGGGVFFYPYGLRYPVFQLKVVGGILAVAGCWQRFPEVAQHSGFSPLAEILELSETGPASTVPIANLKYTADELWRVAEQVALNINDYAGL